MTQLPSYADLAVPVAVDKLFTYSIPEDLRGLVRPGIRVLVPFGMRTVTGFVVRTSKEFHPVAGSGAIRLKAITDVIDPEPVLGSDLLELSRWISEYYFAPLGEVLRAILVRGAFRAGRRTVSLTASDTEAALRHLSHSRAQSAALRAIPEKGPIQVSRLQKKTGIRNIHATLGELAKKGYVTLGEEIPGSRGRIKTERTIEVSPGWKERWGAWLSEPHRPAAQSAVLGALLTLEAGQHSILAFIRERGLSLSTIATLTRKGLLETLTREVLRSTEYDLYPSSLGTPGIVLNGDQRNALEAIRKAAAMKTFHAFLLHGVTGSGKTQVYIEAIRDVLDSGRTAIVLVPEISLTPQIVRRFKYHFGEKVVALHSRMSDGERYDAWRMIQKGEYSVAIGPRSAVFAPFRDLGLIVVDEEQESAYKQFDQTPRYHARDVAIVRASLSGALVVMGSATPSLESYENALAGKYTLLELPSRVDNAKLPGIAIVDMAAERKKKLVLFKEQRRAAWKEHRAPSGYAELKASFGSISEPLGAAIADRLTRNEGIIILQNRRGFSSFIECLECGHVETCEQCNISLTYHITKKHLRCHYCGAVKELPLLCPSCRGTELEYHGFGTQRVEKEISALFPGASLIRMDLDTTTRKGAHDRILRKFSDGEVNILLGTQMVAKGLDFSRVTLVGVISADTQMLLPDFRSAERTFQLLTQVAGRAGRSALAGEVIIQTYQVDHYSLKHVAGHDFRGFYEEEIAQRRSVGYPPFSRIILVEFRGKDEEETMRHAEFLASELSRGDHPHFVTLGPAPAAVSRLKGLYRSHLVIKGSKAADVSSRRLHASLRKALSAYERSPLARSRSVKVIVDVDPAGMM